MGVILALALAGCGGLVHEEQIVGNYYLIAVDTSDQMDVSYRVRDVYIGRIPETVFAVGWNDDYIVAKSHTPGGRGDTEYYYLVRALDSAYADPKVSVRGPLSSLEYGWEKRRLGLPEFTRVLE